MASLSDLIKGQTADYGQLKEAYPNAMKFGSALKKGISDLVPTTEQMTDPNKLINFGVNNTPAGLAIKAYHASPYRFDNFDISKIGTGEGAQAYGRGLYFAEHPMVADDYLREFKSNKNKDSTIYEVDLSWPNKTQEELDPLNKKHLLDYKKDISKQSKYIQNAIENARNKTNEDPLYNGPFISGHLNQTGEDLLDRYGENKLLQAGIPGIRYLNKGSRSQDVNRKTYNLVMFGDEYPQIVKRAGSLDQLLKVK